MRRLWARYLAPVQVPAPAPALVLAMVVVAMVLAGCGASLGKAGPVRTETQSVDKGAATSASADVAQGVGELTVSGGATKLVEAAFTYNVPEWKPEVNYQVSGQQGALTIKQPANISINPGNTKYSWEVRFNDTVPIDLHVELGAGKSTLKLGDLDLSGLDMRSGAGDTTIDLGSYHQGSFIGSIKGGVGKVKLILPRGIGVSVKTTMAIGKTTVVGLKKQGDAYTNDVFGTAKESIQITVETAVGEVDMELAK